METNTTRVTLLKIPLDIVKPEELPGIFSNLIKEKNFPDKKQGQNIVLLSLWDLLRARRNKDYFNYISNAALIIPISKSLVTGVKFLTGQKVYRYMPFKFIVSLLSTFEKQEYPLFLLGGKNKILKKAEKNIRSTFPLIKIIGRYEGRFKKQEESVIIKAIKKSSPSLLLVGKGIRGEEHWIVKNEDRLNSGLRLWCSDLFDVFAEKKHRPSDAIFDRGLECLNYCFNNPFKLFRIIPYIYYKLLLLLHRLNRNSDNSETGK